MEKIVGPRADGVCACLMPVCCSWRSVERPNCCVPSSPSLLVEAVTSASTRPMPNFLAAYRSSDRRRFPFARRAVIHSRAGERSEPFDLHHHRRCSIYSLLLFCE